MILVAQPTALLQITRIGNHYARFALNRLGKEARHAIAFLFQHRFKCLGIVVRNFHKAGSKRTVIRVTIRIATHRYDANGSPVKVPIANHNDGFIFRNAFHPIAPTARQFEPGFHRFGTRIHREHLVVSEVVMHKLFPLTERIVIKGARSETNTIRLIL